MANIDTIVKNLRAWTSSSGQTRFYVNDWEKVVGLNVDYYGTGNVSDVEYDGKKLSNTFFRKYIRGTKVWFDCDGQVHVDYCHDEWFASEIKRKLSEAFA